MQENLDPATTVESMRLSLQRHGQARLAAVLAEGGPLDGEQRRRLAEACAHIDWAELQRPSPHPPDPAAVQPADVLMGAALQEQAPALAKAGAAAYQAGQVAVLIVAGGQGTRLGSHGPKGCLPIAPHSHKSIYQLQAEKVAAIGRRHGRPAPLPAPLLVMTSPATDAETRRFFAEHQRFGLQDVRFFCQGMVPSLDAEGQALLAAPGELLQNPDGHGGCFRALWRSGELARLAREGARYLVYVQVDNILAPVDDPLLVGLCAARDAQVITKVLEKTTPDEKVGHLIRAPLPPRDGQRGPFRDTIIEYTELSPEDVRRRGADGELIYRWGSPAMHCFSVAFLQGLAESGFMPPLHHSRKPLSAWSPTDGQHHEIAGFKCERFIFDLLPEAERSYGLAIDRDAEFAPVKNKSGVDSPDTAVALASRLFRGWLGAAGVAVPAEGFVELSPRLAATEEELRERAARGEVHPHAVPGGCYIEAP